MSTTITAEKQPQEPPQNTVETNKNLRASNLSTRIITTLVNKWLSLLGVVNIPDEIYDLVIYLAVIVFFYFKDYNAGQPRQTWFLPLFVFFTFLFFILYYETIDSVTVYKRMPHKIPKLTLRSCLNTLVNVCILCMADYFTQSYLKRDIIAHISMWEVVVTPVVWLLTQEFTFYFLHRLAHLPSIYPHVHKLHHKYRYSRPAYCQFCQLFEMLFIQVVDSWSVLLVMRPQYYLAIGLSAVMIRHNVGSHRAQPEESNAEVGRHAMHHRDGRYNFGNLSFLDKWMGTEYLELNQT